jgi:hypothetical protein
MTVSFRRDAGVAEVLVRQKQTQANVAGPPLASCQPTHTNGKLLP